MSSVQGGKIVWCLLSTVAKLSGVFCPQWQKGVVSFAHPGKKCLVSFGSCVFCLAPVCPGTPYRIFFDTKRDFNFLLFFFYLDIAIFSRYIFNEYM